MKRKYSYIGMTIIILIFGIIVIPKIVERFAAGEVVENDRLSGQGAKKNLPKNTKTTSADLAYIEIDGERKKVPDFKFVNQHQDSISNESYRGKVYVVEFFFTTCPTICPKMNENMNKLMQNFTGNNQLGIASFSINPQHDTPEVLQEYAKKYAIEHPHWHLLTGDQQAIFDLANKGFNLYVAADPKFEGNFQHSGYFALIDQEGYLRSRTDEFGNPILFYNGLEDDDLQMLKEDIKKLLP